MAKPGKRYVLFGCPIAKPQRYEVKGYIGKLSSGDVGLVIDRSSAIVYVNDKEPGHGAPDDWAKLFKEDYGLNVHPVYLAD